MSLTAVAENLVRSATIIEIDPDVAAVWHAILGPTANALARAIQEFTVNDQTVAAVVQSRCTSLTQRAFRTILLNRTKRNGILNPTAGMLKSGESGHGLTSRWYPDTLAARIHAIHQYRHRISLLESDGLEYMMQRQHDPTNVYFIDPPYGGIGHRLYAHSDVDHHRLFALADTLEGDFLMTYNDVPEVNALVSETGFQSQGIQMNGGAGGDKTELLISRDLTWLSEA